MSKLSFSYVRRIFKDLCPLMKIGPDILLAKKQNNQFRFFFFSK